MAIRKVGNLYPLLDAHWLKLNGQWWNKSIKLKNIHKSGRCIAVMVPQGWGLSLG